MTKNLDLAVLRSFIAVVDNGGVTMAAQQMHITQSAVSMQIKRLEQQIDAKLLQRKGRGVVLTPIGEQFLSYARRLIALNDETWMRMTNDDFEGEISFGVPVDMMEPEVPEILKRCKQLYPRVHINLISAFTKTLCKRFDRGKIDIILATELSLGEGGETLMVEPNGWYGAVEGIAYLQRPLPISLCNNCAMRPSVLKALDEANMSWVNIGDTDSDLTAVNTLLAADLTITSRLRSTTPHAVPLSDDALPTLPDARINMYQSSSGDTRLKACIAEVIRQAFTQGA